MLLGVWRNTLNLSVCWVFFPPRRSNLKRRDLITPAPPEPFSWEPPLEIPLESQSEEKKNLISSLFNLFFTSKSRSLALYLFICSSSGALSQYYCFH